jgi:hypothetical protein
MKTVTDVGNPNVKYNYAVITTEIENAKPEIINKRLIDVPHIGINGGFFEGSYTSPPTSLKSISFWKGDTKQYQYNGTSSNQISRKTFISYWQDGRYRADYRYVKNLNEALGNYPAGYVKAVIGGNDYNLDSWGSTAYYVALNRTVLAWDNAKGKAYMIVTHDRNVNIPVLKNHMTQMGFNPVNSIVLDGSCSSKMRVPVGGVVKYYGCDTENRYIGNMIRVYGSDHFG